MMNKPLESMHLLLVEDGTSLLLLARLGESCFERHLDPPSSTLRKLSMGWQLDLGNALQHGVIFQNAQTEYEWPLNGF